MTYFGAACEFSDGIESKDSYRELIPLFPHKMFHVEQNAQMFHVEHYVVRGRESPQPDPPPFVYSREDWNKRVRARSLVVVFHVEHYAILQKRVQIDGTFHVEHYVEVAS
jgi:hypothetical protein